MGGREPGLKLCMRGESELELTPPATIIRSIPAKIAPAATPTAESPPAQWRFNAIPAAFIMPSSTAA